MRRRVWLLTAVLGCAPRPSTPIEPQPAVPLVTPQPEANALPKPRGAGLQNRGLLSPVAFREGRIELAAAGDEAFAVIDGEPISLRPGQAPVRDPSLGRGLAPDKSLFSGNHELVAFGGSLGPEPTAHVVFAEHFASAGSAYFCYARDADADAWVRRELPRRGGELRIETHYSAIVETGGALLGLRRHAIRSELWDYGDDDPSLAPRLAKLGRELGKAPRGFVVLASEPGVSHKLPKLPKGMDASDAVSTRAGDIVALGYHHRTEVDGDDGPARVLSWAPGEITATITELPGLDDPAIHELGIWSAGDAVLVGGLRDLPGPEDQPYLAVRELDGSFTEVALELPGVHERVASATMTPAGELWIVTGAWNYASEQPCACLWRKPSGGGWEGVGLGPVELFRDNEQRWAHVHAEQTWIEVPAGTPRRLYPAARTVVYASEAIWVTAELGPSYPTAEFVHADPRTVLLSSVPVEAATELIATDRLYDERVDRQVAAAKLTPGSDECPSFTMVVADDPDGAGHEALTRLLANLDALRSAATLEREDVWASASMIYVGELDGHAQLVVEAGAWNPKSAAALADGFAQVLGHRPTLDCRPRALVRAIERLR